MKGSMSKDLIHALSTWLAEDIGEKGFRGKSEIVRQEAVEALQALSLAQIATALYDEPLFQTSEKIPHLKIVDSEREE